MRLDMCFDWVVVVGVFFRFTDSLGHLETRHSGIGNEHWEWALGIGLWELGFWASGHGLLLIRAVYRKRSRGKHRSKYLRCTININRDSTSNIPITTP